MANALHRPFLIGKHIYLRGLELNDLSGPWLQWFNDPQVNRFTSHGVFPTSVEGHTEYYKRVVNSSSDLALAIVEQGSNLHCGNIALHNINWIDRKAELGIVLGDPAVHGKGYGTEAIRLLVGHAFRRLNLHRVWAGMHGQNAGAIRAFEKAGFRTEGRLRGDLYSDHAYHDSVLMAILAEDFAKRGGHKVVATVEARMGSSRLRGKTMRPILGRPMLDLLLERLQRAQRVEEIVVATPVAPENDVIEELCARRGVGCFRGSEDDVLDRVLKAAQSVQGDIIMEITADCPLTEPAIIDQCLEMYFQGDADYVCNFLTRTFPDGYEVQAYATSLLEEVSRKTADPADREHVSKHIHDRPECYRLANLFAPAALNYPGLELHVDTLEQFESVRQIYEALYPKNPSFTIQDVMRFLEANPQVCPFDRSVRRRPRLPGAPYWEEVTCRA